MVIVNMQKWLIVNVYLSYKNGSLSYIIVSMHEWLSLLACKNGSVFTV